MTKYYSLFGPPILFIIKCISVRSGHLEFQSLYATNDMETPSFVVNTLGAPNNSTLVVSIFLVFNVVLIFTTCSVFEGTVYGI